MEHQQPEEDRQRAEQEEAARRQSEILALSEMNYKEQDEEARRYWDAGIRMEE